MNIGFRASNINIPLYQIQIANSLKLQLSTFFFLIHTTFASPFLMHLAYMTFESQEQYATDVEAKMGLYMEQYIAILTSNQIYKP